MSNEMVEIFGTIIHKTDQALLLDDGDTEIWLPLSQIEYSGDIGDSVVVEIPEWICLEKGLI